MNKKLQELLEQRNNLKVEAQNLVGGDVEQFNAKVAEIEAVDAKISQLNEQITALDMINENAPQFNGLGTETVTSQQNVLASFNSTSTEVTDASKIYENAWVKAYTNKAMTAEETAIFNEVNGRNMNNEFTHTTANTGIAIPETVVADILGLAEGTFPLLADVRNFNTQGHLSLPKHTRIVAGDAKAYAEAEATEDEENEFTSLDLTAHEISKAVTLSIKFETMAAKEFVEYLKQEVVDRIGVALGKLISTGRGTTYKEPKGIIPTLTSEEGTPQVKTYAATGATFKDITATIGKVESRFTKGSAFYADSHTVWNVLVNILDNNGRPIFVVDATNEYAGRILGFPVKEDAGVPTGTVIFGNANQGYVLNTQPNSFTLEADRQAKARKTSYVAATMVDGGVRAESAFALLVPATEETPTI